MLEYQLIKASPDDPLPNHLLLLGDENQELIDAYLPLSQRYLLQTDGQTLGVCLVRVEGNRAEVMNIAVEPAFQGRGLGKALLRHVIEKAREQGVQRVVIKTGNSGIGQLALYQQLGFDLVSVNYNYFLHAYPNPIWENNIQCKHQLVFELVLSSDSF